MSTSNSRKVLKGISSQTSVTLALGIVEIVSFSIMSRLLTKEDFGYYAAMMAVVFIFSSFSETGIGASIIQKKELTKEYVNNAFTLSLIFGLFISLLLFFFSGILAVGIADSSMETPLKVMSVTLLLHCLTSVFTSLMHRRLEFLRVGSIQLASLVITTVIAVWLAYIGYGYYAIIAKSVLQSALVFCISFVSCKTRFSISFDIHVFRSIFRFSGWLMASVVFRNLAHQVDKLLMPRLLSVSALGAYNRPKDFIEQISAKLNGIFDVAMFPVLSSIQDELEQLKKAFYKSLYVLNLFAILLTLSFIVNSELLIRIFFGGEWLDLKNVMIILSLSLVFNIDGRLSDCYLRSLGLTREQFYFRVFEAVVKIAGVLIGFPWGIVGVAWAVVITNIASKLLKIIYIASKVNVSAFETAKILVASWKFSVIVIPICLWAYYLLPNTLWGNIALACIFVLVTIFIFIFFPKMVGRRYSQTIHPQLMSFVRKQFHLN